MPMSGKLERERHKVSEKEIMHILDPIDRQIREISNQIKSLSAKKKRLMNQKRKIWEDNQPELPGIEDDKKPESDNPWDDIL